MKHHTCTRMHAGAQACVCVCAKAHFMPCRPGCPPARPAGGRTQPVTGRSKPDWIGRAVRRPAPSIRPVRAYGTGPIFSGGTDPSGITKYPEEPTLRVDWTFYVPTRGQQHNNQKLHSIPPFGKEKKGWPFWLRDHFGSTVPCVRLCTLQSPIA